MILYLFIICKSVNSCEASLNQELPTLCIKISIGYYTMAFVLFPKHDIQLIFTTFQVFNVYINVWNMSKSSNKAKYLITVGNQILS